MKHIRWFAIYFIVLLITCIGIDLLFKPYIIQWMYDIQLALFLTTVVALGEKREE